MYYVHLRFGQQPVLMNYIHIIQNALAKLGEQSEIITDIRKFPKHANLISVTDRSTFLGSVYGRADKIITWYQGIVPEELSLMYEGTILCRPRVALHNRLEKYALSRSDFNIFVSEAMHEHFQLKYGFDKKNYAIMPCFSRELNRDVFNPYRYEAPKFLFSGSMFRWQCIGPMLNLFKKIKTNLPDASLTIFTLEKAEALRMVAEAGVDASVESINPSELNDRMKDFKYGFIVRDDIKVNNVATPTKMNDYMAAGIIPVISNVVEAYRRHIVSPFVIKFDNEEDCVEKIMRFESTYIDPSSIRNSYERVFKKYWDIDHYINLFAERFNAFIQ